MRKNNISYCIFFKKKQEMRRLIKSRSRKKNNSNEYRATATSLS